MDWFIKHFTGIRRNKHLITIHGYTLAKQLVIVYPRADCYTARTILARLVHVLSEE